MFISLRTEVGIWLLILQIPSVGLGQISSYSFLYSKASSIVKFPRLLSVVLVIVTVTNKKAA